MTARSTQSSRAGSHGHCDCIDIGAELRYWQARFPACSWAFAQRFEDCRPTLKFAYDAYLRWHREPLDLLWPRLRHAYDGVAERERLDWTQAHGIIEEVWARIDQAGTCCDGSPAQTRHAMRPPPPATLSPSA